MVMSRAMSSAAITRQIVYLYTCCSIVSILNYWISITTIFVLRALKTEILQCKISI